MGEIFCPIIFVLSNECVCTYYITILFFFIGIDFATKSKSKILFPSDEKKVCILDMVHVLLTM